ncbi:AfsR/SARP family transcriptional regulator [Streptomyces sp. NPDC050704]|uniref:AfsR/SARP family transcriptional regulator n=1 Tax=Streptomyces sp. NPDC050704 TaxID=3157219 RepID=UPI003415F0E3
MKIQIKMLGDMTVCADGAASVPKGDKPRQILALLALHTNRFVATPDLMEEVWGDRPPRSASTMLHNYLLELRSSLQPAAREQPAGEHGNVIAAMRGGYQLLLEPRFVDVHVFRTLLARGHQALGTDDAMAVRTLRSASALWRGPMLAGMRHGPILRAEIARLEEERLATVVQRISAELRLGRNAEVLDELEELTARHSLHEHLHAQRVIALYRLGRREEALGVFGRLRAAFLEELGLEPSATLTRLIGTLCRASRPPGERIPALGEPALAAKG